ncbi:unnamed protein product [Leptosia nina]|uniref:Uncharacterized protein n=1 Tax=Leptosia nina TaxID=320188 RepID=A0AAV1J7T0_9NEOP
MFKSVLTVVAICLVISEARPKWQFLPEVLGYVPVYIQNGDTPLEDINPELAEAFHAIPAGRSAGKLVDAVPDVPDKEPEYVPENIDKRPYEKKLIEKKKKASYDVPKPIEY